MFYLLKILIIFLIAQFSLINISSYPTAPPLEEPIYPFQQYIQVRKSYSVQHLPTIKHYKYNNNNNAPQSSLITSASTVPDEEHQTLNHNEDESYNENEDHYNIGSSNNDDSRLKEEITIYKKQEVYEEKGYKDSAYDHSNYNYSSQTHDNNGVHHDHSYYGAESYQNPRKINAAFNKNHPSDGSSSDLLKYAETNLYDRAAHQHGIYKARAHIYCAEVIDFNLDPENQKKNQNKQLRPNENPKLRGLGDKIKCLKTRYFGQEPLSSAIFQQPSESIQTPIVMGSMEQFMKDVHKNVRGDSSSKSQFQFGQF